MPVIPYLDGVTSTFIDLPHLRMHVAQAGTGEPVLLLHGFPQHWWEWRGVIPLLAKDYRVIVPDLRGAGWTDAPPEGYRKADMVADVLTLLDALHIDRVRIIAHDWGAIVAFTLCFRHPERVRQFVGVSSPHPYIRFSWKLLPMAWRIWFQIAIASPVLGPRLLARGNQRLVRYLLRAYVVDPASTWTADDVEAFLAPLRNAARARAGSALYRELILPEARLIMSGAYRGIRLTTPTRLFFGTGDPGINPELLGGYEEYADDLENVYLPEASHFVVDEKPNEIAERAHDFFRRG
jgi:pimeloyl-ACP methyl ester carboxylesterase